MKVLVTGGAGYIGSHTLSKLLAAGHAPVVFDNLSTGFQEAIPSVVPFVLGNVLDKSTLIATMKEHGIEAVVHFAAKLIVPESVAQPLSYYENNVLGTMRVLEACETCGVKNLIFSSTAAVYGNPKKVPVLENDETLPLSPYGASKLMSERIIDDYSKTRSQFGYVVLRYFNVAGGAVGGNNGQRTKNATHLVKVAAEVAAGKRSQMEIFGTDYPTPDGTGVRDYIHVDDLAVAHVKALEHLQKGGKSEVFNVGYGKGFSVREVLNAMKKVTEKNLEVKESPRRDGDTSVVYADNNKIRRLLNWEAAHDDLELICKTAYNWELQKW